ncbi:hypothetical protein [Trujillonella humicola]|uniref:hypothetical protein n=1 Tax=Trujillonella humicola TaxID=3383699 RepID=UPI003905FD16
MPPYRRARPSLLAFALLTGLALLSAACSPTTGGGGSPAGAGGAAGGEDSVLGMLALLPPLDADELGVVTVTRWHAGAAAHGVEVPGPGADADAILDYVAALTLDDGGLAQGSALLDLTTVARSSTEEDFGFGAQQIAADVSAGLPPRVLSAARGDFDPEAVTEATLAGPVGAGTEQVEVDGVPVLRWLGDLETDLSQRHALSPVGLAGRLGLPDGGTLLHAGSDDGIARLVAAATGGPSLADDEDLAAVAAALDAEGVLAAQLTTRPEGSDLGYDAVGIGLVRDGAARVVLAYATGSAAEAATLSAEVEELLTAGSSRAGGRPWSSLLSDPDVGTEGSLVTVTATVEGPAGLWARFLPVRENLF